MDEIFGEENFVSNIAWRKSDNQANIGQIARVKEYIFCYAKEKDVLNLSKIPLTEKAKKEYSYKDEIGNFRRGILLDKTRGRHFYDVKTKYGNLLKGPWMIKEDEFKKLDQENKVLWTSRGDEQPYKKIYLQESIGQIANDFWDTTFGSNQEASLALEHLLGQRVFDFPKSIKLIKNLLIINNDNDSIILDFFAGSGTTAHAVMQLNAEDGGNRKFILVQIPEPIDPKTNKSAYDFVKNDLNATPTIFEITKERLIRASKQIATTLKEKIQSKELNLSDLESQPDLYNSNQEKINQLKSEIQSLKSQDIHFKIFETVPIWPNYNDEIAEFSSDLKLFDETMLTSEDLQSLLITWKTYDGIPLTQELEEIKLNDYIAHYGNQKLYLIYKSFTIDHLTLLLNRIEDQKDFNPTTIILFAYHFESTILRSISEGIKTYNGRKQLQIDVINRY
jgi:adenine-specific DNA-methyltransferase